jgi:hypothetical protein
MPATRCSHRVAGEAFAAGRPAPGESQQEAGLAMLGRLTRLYRDARKERSRDHGH